MHVPPSANEETSYQLEELLAIKAPREPKSFTSFWQAAYQDILSFRPEITLQDTGEIRKHWQVYKVRYTSTDQVNIGAWLLVPKNNQIRRMFVVGHGYGGRTEPDFHLPFADAAILFPCCRGISISPHPPISSDPYWHVIHNVHLKEKYIIKGCVEDLWVSVTVMETLYPHLKNKLGLIGISFCGGVGALALAQDKRIAKAHFNVPTFGHNPLRIKTPSHGSAKSLQDFFRKEPIKLMRTLRYYDAAIAAKYIDVPVHFALALKDSVVTPLGQFAIFNAMVSNKQLFVLDAGHEHYANYFKQYKQLKNEIAEFFSDLN